MSSTTAHSESMQEKLAKWKASKAQQQFSGTTTTTTSGTLKPKTNIMTKKKLLPEPKSLLLKKKTNVPRIPESKSDLETRPLSDSIVQSTLALVDSISMSNQERLHHQNELDAHASTEPCISSIQSPQILVHDLQAKQLQYEIQELRLANEKLNNWVKQQEQEHQQEIYQVKMNMQESIQSLSTELNSLKTLNKGYEVEIQELQEKLIQSFSEKSDLADKLIELQDKEEEMNQELSEYQSMLEDMKAVAMECEEKNTQVNSLQVELESKDESILSLQVHVFHLKQQEQEVALAFENLQEELKLAQQHIVNNKSMTSQATQSYEIQCMESSIQTMDLSVIRMESSSSQTMESESYYSKNLAILKMSNSVLYQEIQDIQRNHEGAIKALQEQIKSENEKWQQVELEQTIMHKKMMEALEKTINKNKELKKEIDYFKQLQI